MAQPALLPSLLRRWELPKKEMADLATAVRKLARVLWALHVTFQQVRLPGRTCNLEPAHVLWPLIVTSSRSLACLSMHGSVYKAALCALHRTITGQAGSIACHHLLGSLCMFAQQALPEITGTQQVRGLPAV